MNHALFHLFVPTTGQGLFDVTEAVCAWVKKQGIATGLLTVWCRHTSASLLVQANADPEVQADMEAFFVRLAPEIPCCGSSPGRTSRRGDLSSKLTNDRSWWLAVRPLSSQPLQKRARTQRLWGGGLRLDACRHRRTTQPRR